MLPKVKIIGAGLSGCCIARLLADNGFDVSIYEINHHIGGNVYDCYDENGVLIHKFGPHIFHTNNDQVWEFVNRFSQFNDYVNQVLVNFHNQLIEFPINLNSIKQITKNDYELFETEIFKHFSYGQSVSIKELINKITNPSILKIINDIYQNIYANYTAKMWGISIDQIDPNVIDRVKINLDHQWNYFSKDKYQGLPIDGYSVWLQRMIDHHHINLILNYDGLNGINLDFNAKDIIIIYTGPLDRLLNYQYGPLAYRSLHIVFEHYAIESYQPTAVVNYPSDPLITRITEYKKMTFQAIASTTISKEIPGQYNPKSDQFNIPFYPINNPENQNIKAQYMKAINSINNLFLLGRLAQYQYLDMDDVIEQCFNLSQKIINIYTNKK